MDNKLTKERCLNLLTSIILGGFLMYLSKSLGEFVTAFQIFPLLVLYFIEGWKFSLIALIASLAIGLIFVDPLSLAYMAIFMAAGTFFIGNRLKRKKSLSMTILYTAFIKLALILGLMGLSYYISGDNPIELARQMMYAFVDRMADSLSMGIEMTPAEVENYIEIAKEAVNMGVELIPALAFVASYLAAAVNIFLALKITKKSGLNLGYETKFNRYRAGNNLKLASWVIGIVCLIAYIADVSYSSVLIRNLVYVLVFFYMANGFLLVDYVYERNGRKIMRILVPIILFMFIGNLLVYVFIGFLDLLLNIRGKVQTGGKK